jgi:tetratricopeptide (TPR) repeat protein
MKSMLIWKSSVRTVKALRARGRRHEAGPVGREDLRVKAARAKADHPSLVHLAQCSVFDGGFDLVAAESVIGLPDSAEDWTALDALEGLRDHSLIQLGESPLAPGTPRFKLLSSVRAFAQAQQAEQDPGAEAALRHRAYFTEVILPLSKQVGRSDAADSLAGLELELPNLLVAFGHALAADPDAAVDLIAGIRTVFFLRGPRHRTAALLDQVPMAGLTEKKRATCLVFRALGLMDVSDWTAAASVLTEARAAAEASGEPGIQGYVRIRCGDLARHQEDIETAESHYLATIDLAQAGGDWQSEVRAIRRVGMLARARGDGDTAAERYREAIALSDSHGGTLLSASIQNSLGLVLMDMGDLDGAGEQFEHCRSVALTLGGAGIAASALANLGVLNIERGEPEQALVQLREARELAESIGHKLVLAQIEAAIVEAQDELG